MEKFNISGKISDSIVDGPGLRSVVFFQGCSHGCVGCHNEDSWDFSPRKLMTEAEIIDQIKECNFSKKVTLSGGDPMQQDILQLVKMLKAEDFEIWLYTGYELDELNQEQQKVLDYLDVIITGRFELDKRDLSLEFRGSSNQEIHYLSKHRNN